MRSGCDFLSWSPFIWSHFFSLDLFSCMLISFHPSMLISSFFFSVLGKLLWNCLSIYNLIIIWSKVKLQSVKCFERLVSYAASYKQRRQYVFSPIISFSQRHILCWLESNSNRYICTEYNTTKVTVLFMFSKIFLRNNCMHALALPS